MNAMMLAGRIRDAVSVGRVDGAVKVSLEAKTLNGPAFTITMSDGKHYRVTVTEEKPS